MRRLGKESQAFFILVMAGAGILVLDLAPQLVVESSWQLLLFVVLISLTTMFPIPDPRGSYITATPILFYVLLSAHGPGAALLVAAFSYALGVAISVGWIPWRVIFNGAQIGLSVTLAAMVFRSLGGSVVPPGLMSFLVPFTAAAVTHQLANNFFVAFALSRTRQLPLWQTWIADVREFLWSNLLSVTSGALFTILYVSVHPTTLLLFLLSLPFQRRAAQLFIDQRKIHSQAIDSLVLAIDADFPQGRGHSRRVADRAVAIARQMNLSEAQIESIELGALLHDVGMLGLDEVLQSGVTESSPALVRLLRDHVRIGSEVARELPRRDIANIVLYHHEHYNGTGYPEGLAGRQIPLGARIVAVAEAYESMLAGGFPYKERSSPEQAMAAIKEQSGKLFDPRVVEAFLAAVSSEPAPAEPAPALAEAQPEAGA